MFDYNEFCKSQIEWYNRMNEYVDRQLSRVNEDIKRVRKEDKEFVERVWAKGVLTEWDKKHFANGYESADMERYKAERSKLYRDRKANNKCIERYKRNLQKESMFR